MKILYSKSKLPSLKDLDLKFYEDFVLGKQKKVDFFKVRTLKLKKLELFNIDIWGPAQVCSHSVSYYFITFLDDVAKKLWI